MQCFFTMPEHHERHPARIAAPCIGAIASDKEITHENRFRHRRNAYSIPRVEWDERAMRALPPFPLDRFFGGKEARCRRDAATAG
ncbi:hypothetical protein KL86DPRO_30053 [uncultured delta proteobacterium]|uniref:Uncharacterized protein n=1 Tax=uncultured delta proteobacterium TaxID=34034 RepID=A0A212K6T2_9DELT|nr:hypothetical protein KL86DPRO_30053 [uncultured delta proteobacterium]